MSTHSRLLNVYLNFKFEIKLLSSYLFFILFIFAHDCPQKGSWLVIYSYTYDNFSIEVNYIDIYRINDGGGTCDILVLEIFLPML